MKHFARLLPTLFLVVSVGSLSGADEPSPQPQLISLFPLGGRAGETLEVEVRGKFLDPLRLAWFYCDQLTAELIQIEVEASDQADGDEAEEKDAEKQKYRGLLRVRIEDDADLGAHYFRVVTPAGISNPLRFRVTSETNMREVESPHDHPDTAQPIDSFPTVVHGRLPELGEMDYYSFQASSGDLLCFEIDFLSSSAPMGLWTFRPTLSIYELKGSWFDPSRRARLTTNNPMLHRPTLDFRLPKDGEYFLEVGEISGKPGKQDDNPGYQLRVFAGGDSDQAACHFELESLAHEAPLKWTWGGEGEQALVPTVDERDFSRRIEEDWIERLWSRSVRGDQENSSDAAQYGPPESGAAAAGRTLFDSLAESEPNDTTDRALHVPALPAVLEGVIESPGDVDLFRFKVDSGDSLAFEIETPLRKPSHFIPWMTVLSADGEKIVANLNKWWGRSGNFVVKGLGAKTVYRFEEEGEYFVRVRDVTSRHGGPDFRYRLLVRPQVPHVGAVRPAADHVQVTPGQASTLDVVVELEEGFQGDVLLSIENLPPGLKAFPALASEPDRPDEVELPELTDEKLYRPKSQKVTIALLADPDTLPDLQPRFIDLIAQPIVNGAVGDPLAITRLPLLVLAGEDDGKDQRIAALNE